MVLWTLILVRRMSSYCICPWFAFASPAGLPADRCALYRDRLHSYYQCQCSECDKNATPNSNTMLA
jgi:hypothetical protein